MIFFISISCVFNDKYKFFSYICLDKRKDKTLTYMKRILSIVCIAATAWLLTACGSVIQLPRNGMNGGIKTYTF